jgi:plasmid segregation protein ParM
VVYLAGGGALEFGDLVSMLPAAKVLPDPQWANAEGFLSALQAKLQKNSLKAISTSAGT